MIEYITNLPILVLIAVWLLFGFLWVDFLIYLKRRYMLDNELNKSVRIATTILWPLSVLMFIYGVIDGVIKYFKQ